MTHIGKSDKVSLVIVMRCAYQTLIFGPSPNPEWMLDAVRRAGFAGIELAQSPSELYPLLKTPQEAGHSFGILLAKMKLNLIGLVGGSISQRIDFLKGVRSTCDLATEDCYLYVEALPANEDAALAESENIPLALHPHVYKKIHRLSDAEKILQTYPKLRWIPDTAHLTIANDPLIPAIDKFAKQVAAVHLKDWTPIYGRASHRYSRGFKVLGEGTVDLVSVINFLLHAEAFQDCWVVAEQDHTFRDVQTDVRIAADYMRWKGLPMGESLEAVENPVIEAIAAEESHDKQKLRLYKSLSDALNSDFSLFYPRLGHSISDYFSANFVAIAALSETNNTISPIATVPPMEPLPWTFETNENWDFFQPFSSVDAPGPLAERARQLDAAQLMYLPIVNTYNSNHQRYVLLIGLAASLAFPGPQILREACDQIGRTIDLYQNDYCTVASNSAGLATTKATNAKEFLEKIHDQILKWLDCETCAFFLPDSSGKILQFYFGPKFKWAAHIPIHEQFYQVGDGSYTAPAWERMEAQIHERFLEHDRFRSDDSASEQPKDRSSLMCVPILQYGQRSLQNAQLEAPRGVMLVRCRNKKTRPFSDDDLAVVEAIMQSQLAEFLLLLAEEQRQIAVSKLRHELRNPLVAILNQLENLEFDLDRIRREHGIPVFKYSFDFLGDIKTAGELMEHLIQRLRFSGAPADRPPLKVSRLHLLPLVHAARRQLASEIKQKGLPDKVFDFVDLDVLPELYLDQQRMLQVLYNLMDNAIKYSNHTPKSPAKITIHAKLITGGYEIAIKDNGLGVDPGFEEAIFADGVRGISGLSKNIEGSGFGLALVRELVEAHQGWIKLTHRANPTVFTVFLPEELKKPSWHNELHGRAIY